MVANHPTAVQAPFRDEGVISLLQAYPIPVKMARADSGEVIYESPEAARLFQRERDLPGRDQDDFVSSHDYSELIGRARVAETVENPKVQLKKSDETVFWASVSARLVEWRGEVVIVSTIADLTEHKAIGYRIAHQNEELHQSEKLAALGSLLAGVAHELNNPLSVVAAQALLMKDTVTDPMLVKRATKIANAADRCTRIVRTFLALARQRPLERKAVSINEVVEAVLDVTRYSLRTAGIEPTLDLGEDLPRIWGDMDELNQVVTNLVVNAQQAMSECDESRQLRIVSAYDREENTVLLSISDNGPEFRVRFGHVSLTPSLLRKRWELVQEWGSPFATESWNHLKEQLPPRVQRDRAPPLPSLFRSRPMGTLRHESVSQNL